MWRQNQKHGSLIWEKEKNLAFNPSMPSLKIFMKAPGLKNYFGYPWGVLRPPWPLTPLDPFGGVWEGLTESEYFMCLTPKCDMFWKALVQSFNKVLSLAKPDKFGRTWLNLAKLSWNWINTKKNHILNLLIKMFVEQPWLPWVCETYYC